MTNKYDIKKEDLEAKKDGQRRRNSINAAEGLYKGDEVEYRNLKINNEEILIFDESSKSLEFDILESDIISSYQNIGNFADHSAEESKEISQKKASNNIDYTNTNFHISAFESYKKENNNEIRQNNLKVNNDVDIPLLLEDKDIALEEGMTINKEELSEFIEAVLNFDIQSKGDEKFEEFINSELNNKSDSEERADEIIKSEVVSENLVIKKEKKKLTNEKISSAELTSSPIEEENVSISTDEPSFYQSSKDDFNWNYSSTPYPLDSRDYLTPRFDDYTINSREETSGGETQSDSDSNMSSRNEDEYVTPSVSPGQSTSSSVSSRAENNSLPPLTPQQRQAEGNSQAGKAAEVHIFKVKTISQKIEKIFTKGEEIKNLINLSLNNITTETFKNINKLIFLNRSAQGLKNQAEESKREIEEIKPKKILVNSPELDQPRIKIDDPQDQAILNRKKIEFENIYNSINNKLIQVENLVENNQLKKALFTKKASNLIHQLEEFQTKLTELKEKALGKIVITGTPPDTQVIKIAGAVENIKTINDKKLLFVQNKGNPIEQNNGRVVTQGDIVTVDNILNGKVNEFIFNIFNEAAKIDKLIKNNVNDSFKAVPKISQLITNNTQLFTQIEEQYKNNIAPLKHMIELVKVLNNLKIESDKLAPKIEIESKTLEDFNEINAPKARINEAQNKLKDMLNQFAKLNHAVTKISEKIQQEPVATNYTIESIRELELNELNNNINHIKQKFADVKNLIEPLIPRPAFREAIKVEEPGQIQQQTQGVNPPAAGDIPPPPPPSANMAPPPPPPPPGNMAPPPPPPGNNAGRAQGVNPNNALRLALTPEQRLDFNAKELLINQTKLAVEGNIENVINVLAANYNNLKERPEEDGEKIAVKNQLRAAVERGKEIIDGGLYLDKVEEFKNNFNQTTKKLNDNLLAIKNLNIALKTLPTEIQQLTTKLAQYEGQNSTLANAKRNEINIKLEAAREAKLNAETRLPILKQETKLLPAKIFYYKKFKDLYEDNLKTLNNKKAEIDKKIAEVELSNFIAPLSIVVREALSAENAHKYNLIKNSYEVLKTNIGNSIKEIKAKNELYTNSDSARAHADLEEVLRNKEIIFNRKIILELKLSRNVNNSKIALEDVTRRLETMDGEKARKESALTVLDNSQATMPVNEYNTKREKIVREKTKLEAEITKFTTIKNLLIKLLPLSSAAYKGLFEEAPVVDELIILNKAFHKEELIKLVTKQKTFLTNKKLELLNLKEKAEADLRIVNETIRITQENLERINNDINDLNAARTNPPQPEFTERTQQLRTQEIQLQNKMEKAVEQLRFQNKLVELYNEAETNIINPQFNVQQGNIQANNLPNIQESLSQLINDYGLIGEIETITRNRVEKYIKNIEKQIKSNKDVSTEILNEFTRIKDNFNEYNQTKEEIKTYYEQNKALLLNIVTSLKEHLEVFFPSDNTPLDDSDLNNLSADQREIAILVRAYKREDNNIHIMNIVKKLIEDEILKQSFENQGITSNLLTICQESFNLYIRFLKIITSIQAENKELKTNYEENRKLYEKNLEAYKINNSSTESLKERLNEALGMLSNRSEEVNALIARVNQFYGVINNNNQNCKIILDNILPPNIALTREEFENFKNYLQLKIESLGGNGSLNIQNPQSDVNNLGVPLPPPLPGDMPPPPPPPLGGNNANGAPPPPPAGNINIRGEGGAASFARIVKEKMRELKNAIEDHLQNGLQNPQINNFTQQKVEQLKHSIENFITIKNRENKDIILQKIIHLSASNILEINAEFEIIKSMLRDTTTAHLILNPNETPILKTKEEEDIIQQTRRESREQDEARAREREEETLNNAANNSQEELEVYNNYLNDINENLGITAPLNELMSDILHETTLDNVSWLLGLAIN